MEGQLARPYGDASVAEPTRDAPAKTGLNRSPIKGDRFTWLQQGDDGCVNGRDEVRSIVVGTVDGAGNVPQGQARPFPGQHQRAQVGDMAVVIEPLPPVFRFQDDRHPVVKQEPSASWVPW